MGQAVKAEMQPANLAVVQFGEAWRIWLTHGWFGLFGRKADALQCALDVAFQVKRDGRPTNLFVQGPFGEFVAMPSSPTEVPLDVSPEAPARREPRLILALDLETTELKARVQGRTSDASAA